MDIQLILKNRSYYKKRITFILEELPRITGIVLDLGCGEMILADKLQLNENVEVLGIDEQRFKESNFFIQGDAVQYISSTTRRFDYIFCLGLIDHLNPIDRESCINSCLEKINTCLIVNAANSDNIFFKLFKKTIYKENELFLNCK
ncbi:MAG: class I SAM-dependent methyltransferase, partial [Saprospiraceae bacterium]